LGLRGAGDFYYRLHYHLVRRVFAPSQEITAGDLFLVEFAGKLQLTRMKFRYRPRRGYYTVDGYPLRDGLRAAIGEHG
jgi:hypothetical protein